MQGKEIRPWRHTQLLIEMLYNVSKTIFCLSYHKDANRKIYQRDKNYSCKSPYLLRKLRKTRKLLPQPAWCSVSCPNRRKLNVLFFPLWLFRFLYFISVLAYMYNQLQNSVGRKLLLQRRLPVWSNRATDNEYSSVHPVCCERWETVWDGRLHNSCSHPKVDLWPCRKLYHSTGRSWAGGWYSVCSTPSKESVISGCLPGRTSPHCAG